MFPAAITDTPLDGGYAWEWRPPPGPPAPGTVGYNDARHLAVAARLRRQGSRLAFSLAATFDLPGDASGGASGRAPGGASDGAPGGALDSAFRRLAGRHEVLRCPGSALTRVAVGPVDEPAAYLAAAFAALDPLDGPLFRFGAIVRETSTTAWLAFDHVVADTLSVVHAAAELDAALRDHHTPAPVAGYLSFARRQRATNAALTGDDPLLDRWRRFGDPYPALPLDLGVPPGRSSPPVNETDTLLTAPEAAALESRCRAAGAPLFAGVLAAVATTLARDGRHRTLMLVNERGSSDHARSLGWYVNALPLTIPVPPAANFATLLRATLHECSAARTHAGVHFLRAWQLLHPSHDPTTRYWPHPVNLFSYLDLRTPAHHLRSARLHHGVTTTNGYTSWLIRTADGLHLNALYPDTPTARRSHRTTVTTVTTLTHTLRTWST